MYIALLWMTRRLDRDSVGELEPAAPEFGICTLCRGQAQKTED